MSVRVKIQSNGLIMKVKKQLQCEKHKFGKKRVLNELVLNVILLANNLPGKESQFSKLRKVLISQSTYSVTRFLVFFK